MKIIVIVYEKMAATYTLNLTTKTYKCYQYTTSLLRFYTVANKL